mgnify:CR=1 FL=1
MPKALEASRCLTRCKCRKMRLRRWSPPLGPLWSSLRWREYASGQEKHQLRIFTLRKRERIVALASLSWLLVCIQPPDSGRCLSRLCSAARSALTVSTLWSLRHSEIYRPGSVSRADHDPRAAKSGRKGKAIRPLRVPSLPPLHLRHFVPPARATRFHSLSPPRPPPTPTLDARPRSSPVCPPRRRRSLADLPPRPAPLEPTLFNYPHSCRHAFLLGSPHGGCPLVNFPARNRRLARPRAHISRPRARPHPHHKAGFILFTPRPVRGPVPLRPAQLRDERKRLQVAARARDSRRHLPERSLRRVM